MSDYDMSIHHNPDAMAWAKFFVETTKDMDREAFRDEGYMVGWFANAMMAMYDFERKKLLAHMHDLEKQVRVAAGLISTMHGFSDKHPEYALEFIEKAAGEKA